MENPLHSKKVIVYKSEEEDIMKINFKRFLHSVANRDYSKFTQLKKKKKDNPDEPTQPIDGKILQVID